MYGLVAHRKRLGVYSEDKRGAIERVYEEEQSDL